MRLDRALAEGGDPGADPALALRAAQLRNASTRSAIATTVEHLLDAAAGPADALPHGGPRPPLQQASLLDARDELLALADALRSPRAPSAQTVALAALLVWDSASPAYSPYSGATVTAWARAAGGTALVG